ncbi:MAG: DUF192 domain-containing protein [Candidatus Aenigmarchaeota archaeon]|nr:DUF192 domain-containing protein [Candidatus Aenigmarchaeota archaeon]
MKIKTKGKTIEVDLADSFLKRIVGLSLSKKKNMLFQLPVDDRWSLWMFLVRYQIDMIFLDSEKKVVDIKKGIPISLNPKTWKVYTPKKECRYILETPFDLKIKIGDKFSW